MHIRIIILIYLLLEVISCRTPSATIKETGDIPYFPLNDKNDIDILLKDIGKAKIVLLGESSHGMSDFMEWRAAISKRLIEDRGFDLIAVEGDYTEIEPVDSFINANRSDSSQAVSVLKNISRWPAWIWCNREFASFITWLNHHNQQNKTPVHICGLDLFSISSSVISIRKYLHDSSLQHSSERMEQCFSKFENDALKYAGRFEKYGSCTNEAEKLNEVVSRIKGSVPKHFRFPLQQHARVVYNGEQYFKNLAKQRVSAWNIRDNHMLQTIKDFLETSGPHSKLIVWAHNTHIGDAHYSYMTMQGKTNIGELLRKEFGRENVYITGLGSYKGTVITADAWGDPAQIVAVPPAQKDSWEERLHRINSGSKFIRCTDLRNNVELLKWMPQRALGAVYQAVKDSQIYVPSVIPWRYDGFIFINETHALHPLNSSGKLKTSGILMEE